ncbi:MAG: hypothetical protein A2X86_08855 [Bdellovibrionales bacterium GWA2_49_15]|nr:MAG: hypothetical protein A2X86_08855 [Bdellovibrionales bacterium GWA2_49_15]HAZ12886.1 hypothetical protein [Bdellovibrionales bacterium]
MRSLKLIVVTLMFLTLGQLHAAVIKVPDRIDFASTSTSFKFSDSAQSSTGKKSGWSGWLMPNGTFYISGIYLGETFDSCSSRGGKAEVVLDNNNVRRQELMKLALLAYNENQNAPVRDARGAYELGPRLSVELGTTIENVVISNYGTHTQNFRRELRSEVEKIFDNPALRQNALELSVVVEKDKVIYTLTNIGQKEATLMLPDSAAKHFTFRPDDESLSPVGLTYAEKLSSKVRKLKPSETFKMALLLPKDIDIHRGVFLYDNLNRVRNVDRTIVPAPYVQLCMRLK